MDIEIYLKKVYTVAYRLTGKEKVAVEIAELAITNTAKQLNGNNKITESMLQLTILELVKIFLKKSGSHCNDNLMGIQRALLTLKPLNRALVIWKDVLGYKISDNIPVFDCTYEELAGELVCGRKELKNQYSGDGPKCTTLVQ